MKPALGHTVLYRGWLAEADVSSGIDFCARIIRVRPRLESTRRMREDWEELDRLQKRFEVHNAAFGLYQSRPTAEEVYCWEHHFEVWLAIDSWTPLPWSTIAFAPRVTPSPVEFCAEGAKHNTWRWPERIR